MQLGFDDTMARANDVRTFFDVDQPAGMRLAEKAQARSRPDSQPSRLTERWLRLIGRA